jgi:hypothetical protein
MMARLLMADYRVTLPEDCAEAISAQIPGFMAAESVMAVRKTKSGEKLTDIRPMAVSVSAEGNVLTVRTTASETNNLKPDLLVNVLAERAGIATPENVRVHRLTLLGDENGAIVPLMDLKG